MVAKISGSTGLEVPVPVEEQYGGTGETASNIIIQHVTNSNITPDSTTTTIPFDSSKPQNTEGKELFTFGFNPINADSRLIIDFGAIMASSTVGSAYTLAIFKDSDIDAIGCTSGRNENGAGYNKSIRGNCEITLTSSDPITFKVRFGPSSGTAYINSTDGATDVTQGGLNPAFVRIMEITP